LVPALVQGNLEAEITYDTPVRAPIAKGDVIGLLKVNLQDMEPVELPLVAERDVPRGGFVPRLRTATSVLIREFLGPSTAAQ
jgi:D-alanyl-D-alanine carboxypeptidase (penicillin-binding protein 5/6)